MKPEIRMVDLATQYKHISAEVDAAIHSVLESTAFIKGVQLERFQENLAKYTGASRVLGCANGTDALQVAMMALDLQPGDEVITTPFTFVATVEVLCLLRIKPVLADVDPRSFTILPEEIEKQISNKTRAIVPVHLFGQCCPMDKIMELANRHKLHVIEDTAQAMGTRYLGKDFEGKMAGTMGAIGCTSFFPSKNLGAFGDGGALFTNDPVLGDRMAAILNHGMKRRYYYDYIGVNSRLDTLQAAILDVKLKYLDQYNLSRKQAADIYDQQLNGINGVLTPVRSGYSDHTFHQYTLRVRHEMRDGLKDFLGERGIPSMIYYPVGLHMQHAYRDLGYREGDFPVTEMLCKEVLSLPMHTELNLDQQMYICNSIKEFMS